MAGRRGEYEQEEIKARKKEGISSGEMGYVGSGWGYSYDRVYEAV